MKDFNLQDYVPQIVSVAETNKVGAAEAVGLFIANLNTMNDHYKGASELNYRVLGQQWNKLNYKIRNKQRLDVLPLVAKKILPPPIPTRTRTRKGV